MGKKTKVALAIAAASAAAWAGTKAMSKPQKREDKDVLKGRPFVIAHRGGAQLAPEHSMLAFEKSVELGVDGFQIDIRLTKDEEIILFSDDSVERTSTSSGFIKDLTLAELKQINFGANFECLDGNKIYEEDHIEVVTLREVLEKFNDKVFVIDIKDNPDTYEGSLMPSKLWRLIEELNVSNQIIVTSAYSEQIDRFNLYAQNRVALGAGDAEITKAYTAFTSQFGHLYSPKVDVFVIPLKSSVMNFDSPKFIQFLKDLNVPVIFKGINDLVTMSRLTRTGAQGIVTDRPDSAQPLLQKYQV